MEKIQYIEIEGTQYEIFSSEEGTGTAAQEAKAAAQEAKTAASSAVAANTSAQQYAAIAAQEVSDKIPFVMNNTLHLPKATVSGNKIIL